VATHYAPSSRVLWSLAASSQGTTLAALGNSNPNGWNATNANARSTLDLRDVTDVWLSVYVAGAVAGGAPSLVANLDLYDDAGNLFAAVASTAAITTTTTGKGAALGLHTGGANAQALPGWGRVSWTVGTGSFAGVEICVFGR
jgi:hypothetical protein